MKRLFRALLALVVLAACATIAQAQYAPPERLVVVADANYPPYLFRGSDGELRGVVRDRWALWSRATGIEVRIESLDWALAQ